MAFDFNSYIKTKGIEVKESLTPEEEQAIADKIFARDIGDIKNPTKLQLDNVKYAIEAEIKRQNDALKGVTTRAPRGSKAKAPVDDSQKEAYIQQAIKYTDKKERDSWIVANVPEGLQRAVKRNATQILDKQGK